MTRILAFALVLAAWPGAALAYVDPGILGALYQLAYAFLFGLVTIWIIRPWRYLKSLFNRQRTNEAEKSEEQRLDEAKEN